MQVDLVAPNGEKKRVRTCEAIVPNMVRHVVFHVGGVTCIYTTAYIPRIKHRVSFM
jgi:hypothetical protein